MVYDLNETLSQIRSQRRAEVQEQMRLLDEQILALTHQTDRVGATREILGQMDATLLRMAMLAREAAARQPVRPGLLQEFEDCRQRVAALAEQAKHLGLDLSQNPAGTIQAMMESLEP